MAISPSLSRKLRETLGEDAGGDLVTWLDEEREARVKWMDEERAARARVDATLAEFRHDMLAMETRLSGQIADVKSDLMKWSFVFWCGAVAAVAALAGVLRP